ncbi:MAG: hypothetical protein ACPGU7_07180 [Gammaproteobacteria bacterium]
MSTAKRKTPDNRPETTATGDYLHINFGGYFLCRIATDPDPSDDPYGTSGYTMALANEPLLNQLIRTEPDGGPQRDSDLPGLPIGVKVTTAGVNGAIDPDMTFLLANARVHLGGYDGVEDAPVFVSNNNTVGSDDTMSFVVEPFRMTITGASVTLPIREFSIHAEDDLVPGEPKVRAVDIPQPSDYARRLNRSFTMGSAQAHQAIGVYDEYGYFRARRAWLRDRIATIQALIDGGACPDVEDCLLQLEGYRSRLFQIEQWGDRVINKLGFLCQWEHDINGAHGLALDLDAHGHSEILGGTVRADDPWRVRYWFGGWDGDLLTGYMSGTLEIPFTSD